MFPVVYQSKCFHLYIFQLTSLHFGSLASHGSNKFRLVRLSELTRVFVLTGSQNITGHAVEERLVQAFLAGLSRSRASLAPRMHVVCSLPLTLLQTPSFQINTNIFQIKIRCTRRRYVSMIRINFHNRFRVHRS
jgi:hypothetical protein